MEYSINAQGCAVFMHNNDNEAFNAVEEYGVSKNFLKFMEDNYVNRSKEFRCGDPE
ncbi:MAG: hypothetical protein RDV48_24670 [Candidatus Eremiobacteraeota bacterium]|nr:hypothetical protein [Candidatus Eremiobacteraeota bacterium]